jgi:hydroxyacylglutathione hydrolase
MLSIVTFILGPVATNCYLVADPGKGEAAVIDPAWNGQVIVGEARQRGWKIQQLWYTHGHFDHFAGAGEIVRELNPAPTGSPSGEETIGLPGVALHSLDLPLWKNLGGAPFFGVKIDPGPQPTIDLALNQVLSVGDNEFKVLHTPGHTPGHVIFYCSREAILFSGDLIFRRGVGRTDLPGGDWQALVRSIRSYVYALPDETRILAGHGEETNVAEEKRLNPFVPI